MPTRRVNVGRARGMGVTSRRGGKPPKRGKTSGKSTTPTEARKILERARQRRKKK